MNDVLLACLSSLLVLAGVGAGVSVVRCFIAEHLESQRERAQRRARWGGRFAPSLERGVERRADRLACAAMLAVGMVPAGHAMGQDLASTSVKDSAYDSVKLNADTSLALQAPAAAPLVISTDRPSFSDGTGIVPVGHLQLETGYTFTFRNRDNAEAQRHNGPELLARVALVEDRFELRFITSGYVWSRTDDGSGSGFASSEGWSDASLGLKLKVLDQDGWVPRVAIGAQSTLGAGSDNISSQTAEPILKLLWSYDLGAAIGEDWKGFTLGGNANIGWPTTNGDRFTQGQGSVYLAFPLADRLSGFAEYYVIGPNAKGTDAAYYVDIGGALLVNDRIQLDARVGFGLNQAADNVYCGFGLSVLF